MVSYVYVMKNNLFPDIYKIGKSSNPDQRKRSLNTMHQNFIDCISLYVGRNGSVDVMERKLLNRFSKQNVCENNNEEWFRLSDDDLSEIENIVLSSFSGDRKFAKVNPDDFISKEVSGRGKRLFRGLEKTSEEQMKEIMWKAWGEPVNLS